MRYFANMKDNLHMGKNITGLLSFRAGNADFICCTEDCTIISNRLALINVKLKLSFIKLTINSYGTLVNMFKHVPFDLIPTTS